MINVYSGFETDFEKNGKGVLTPTVCNVVEDAGGSYDLTLTHPIDPAGKWKHLTAGSIIKCPVPRRMTLQAEAGDKLDLYRVQSAAEMRSAPSEPYKVSYPPWYYHSLNVQGYLPGDKVTDWQDGHNYQCVKEPFGATARYFRPSHPLAGEFWQRIPDEAGGAPVLATLRAGNLVYMLERYSTSWWRVATLAGLEGYVRASALVYDRTVASDTADTRTVRTQLFRICDVNVDGAKMLVKVQARHASYDYDANLLNDLVITQQPPAVALALIRNAMTIPSENVFSTNLTAADGLYTRTHSWSNTINALLDPDTGLVPAYKAQLVRDNWDIYIYRNEPVYRGVGIERGNNLVGVSWRRDSSKVINRIIPVAKDAAGNDLYLDGLFVESQYIDTYPVIREERLKVDGQVGKDDGQGGTYTEESLKEYMTAKALERFTTDKADMPKEEIRVDFVLLGDTEEYARYKDLQKLYLYDLVAVRDSVLELDRTMQVVAYTWDAIAERYTGITLGDLSDFATSSIAGYELKNGSININKLSPAALAELKGV